MWAPKGAYNGATISSAVCTQGASTRSIQTVSSASRPGRDAPTSRARLTSTCLRCPWGIRRRRRSRHPTRIPSKEHTNRCESRGGGVQEVEGLGDHIGTREPRALPLEKLVFWTDHPVMVRGLKPRDDRCRVLVLNKDSIMLRIQPSSVPSFTYTSYLDDLLLHLGP